MAKWKIALALLVLAALAHVVAVVRQLRHYRQVFAELGTRSKDGRIGVGMSGQGVIAIVVVDPTGIVHAVRVRQGRGIFGKFLPRDAFLGLDMAAAKARAQQGGFEPLVGPAIVAAIAEIESKSGGAA